MTQHEIYMQRCFELAKLGVGNVSPNPMVGSVIVHDNQIIGEGWHQKYGKAHAEVNAIASVEDKSLLKEATIYVSLEPCHHFGKTPPCVDLILEHQIPKVVVGTKDPNALVAGQSIEKLKNAGVEVTVGVLNEKAVTLDKGFISKHKNQRPYVILKWAQSKNGYFAPLEGQQWLSNEHSKRLTHKWRNAVDAILVGKNTVLQDNPVLTDRFWQGHHPLRVIIDPQLEIGQDHNVYNDGRPTLVFNALKKGKEGVVQYIQLDHYCFTVKAMIKHLNQLKINTILVEGGAFTLNNFIESNYWDEAYVYKTNIEIEYGIDVPELNEFARKEVQPIADNQLEIFYNE